MPDWYTEQMETLAQVQYALWKHGVEVVQKRNWKNANDQTAENPGDQIANQRSLPYILINRNSLTKVLELLYKNEVNRYARVTGISSNCMWAIVPSSALVYFRLVLIIEDGVTQNQVMEQFKEFFNLLERTATRKDHYGKTYGKTDFSLYAD